MKLPKDVIGVKRFTNWQFFKIYTVIWIYAIAFLYVVIRNMMCDCATATIGEGLLVMICTLVVFLFTRWMYRKEERKNYIYNEKAR